MHDAVGVVNGHGAVLTEAAPLECCAERSDLDFLVLLLPGKFHEHLQDAAAGLACLIPNELMEGRAAAASPTCSKVDWEKLYSSKLNVCLAEGKK